MSWTTAAILLGGALCSAFLLPSRLGSVEPSVFTLWTLAPYAMLLCSLYYARSSRGAAWTLLLGSLLVAGMAVVVTVETFFVMSSTSGLILLFLPLWQGAAALVTLLITFRCGLGR